MHFTNSELKEIHDGLISLFGKKDSDIDALEGSPSANDTVVIMHNNINKKTTVGNLIGHDTPLATVATSGSYNDLNNKPTIPAAPVQSNWNEADTNSLAYIENKPTIPAAQVNSDWEEVAVSSKSFIRNKPEIRPSYIPYTDSVDEGWIEEYSYLDVSSKFDRIVHTVIVEPISDFPSNYDLTPYVEYYMKVLAGREPSIIRIEFMAFNSGDVTTYIDTSNLSQTMHLYGKFALLVDNVYTINTPNSTISKCCIEIMNVRKNEEDVFYVNCEVLGNYVGTIINE